AQPTTGPCRVRTAVLGLPLRGGGVVRADLLQFPQTRDEDSPPVRLFDDAPATYYAAQSGWVSQANAAPTHEAGFLPEGGRTAYALAGDVDTLEVPFVWTGPDGTSIRRSYVLTRGSYAIEVRDTVRNQGS